MFSVKEPLINLNTSHVKVKLNPTSWLAILNLYLNTSHVKVKLKLKKVLKKYMFYLNTSHVKVKRN